MAYPGAVSAPSYVPRDPSQRVRRYTSPPRRNDSWTGDRPGDVSGGQPSGHLLGSQGPDQGFAYHLVDHVGDLHLGRVQRDDAVSGCVAIGMKRAAAFGRAPVVWDVKVGFGIWGFLDPSADPELVGLREELFSEIHNPHHYVERREVVDLSSTEVLKRPHTAILADYEADWRRNLAV